MGSFEPVEPQTPADLRALYASIKSDICNRLRATFGDGPPEPEDMAQAAFEKFTALDDPSKVINPKAFLYAAARNLTLDELRRRERARRWRDDVAARADQDRADQATPERVLIGRESFAVVREAIENMPQTQREVLLLHRLEGLSLNDVARRTGMSKTTVHRHVVNAMAQLHSALKSGE